MKNNNIAQLIKDYKSQIKSRCKTNNCISHDTHIDYTLKQKSLKEAIIKAAISLNESGKKHPHQYRVKKSALEILANELTVKYFEIQKVKNFDELLTIVSKTNVHGIGVLTCYDVALRIGMFLKILPDRVYLHAGTRIGAEKLLGKIAGHSIDKSQLPKEFRKLQCWEIEDILCTMKDKF